MMFVHRLCRAAIVLAMFMFTMLLNQAVLADDAKPGKATGAKPARPMVALLTGGAEADLKVLRETWKRSPASSSRRRS
jgi:hypothetical protein